MIDLRLRINDFGFWEKKTIVNLFIFKKNGQHKNIENHNSLIVNLKSE
jgi:hypothetical protein